MTSLLLVALAAIGGVAIDHWRRTPPPGLSA